MKIVHELHHPDPQVVCDVHPYDKGGKSPPAWNGARVEVMAVDCRQPKDGKPFAEGDAFHLEGDIDTIRKVCTEILDQLNTMENFHRREIQKQATRSAPCAVCGFHVTPEQLRAGHGDGRGMACFGDGTVRIGSVRATIQGSPREVIYTTELKKDDRFLLHHGHWKEFRNYVFVALADADEDGVLVQRPVLADDK